MSRDKQKNILTSTTQRRFDKLREVASEEVRSLLTHGYRSVGSLRDGDCECFYLRNPHNKNRASVVIAVDKVRVYKNGEEVQTYE